MEFKTDALLLKSVDYGESDKVITLLTADRGKLTAGMKGVRKAGAKLRFAAQPFCFAEYVLAARGGRNTVTSAALHNGFYSICENVNAFFAAACVAETCDQLVRENMESGELLVYAVNALKNICEGETSFALVVFLTEALRFAGYPIAAEKCGVCGGTLSGRMCFDMESGSFTCSECGVGVPASESTYLVLRAANGNAGERSEDGEKRALRLLRTYFLHQTESDLPSLGEYLKML